MTESGFRRYQCWDERRIGEVINKEAVSVEPPEFMATHGPISDIRYLRSPSAIASTSESGLLDELLRSAQESRHAFVVIQGIPGTGKSHLIRWLQRRYQAESQGNEVVLLIERAQNSLLGTLRQLIDKVDFADEGMRQQLAKLKGAAESLSDRALADSIVDNLRVATYERPLPPGERLNSRIRNNIEHFLLDPVVRDELKRPEGPVERITRFLAAGGSAPNGDGRPQFVAEDFDLRPEVLRAIRDEGLREARELADGLNIKAELRVELARYLNRLLDYAISRTVVLSGDDLKQIFNDLRRHLRRQGKSLVLFIEDITAFTGIDNGLIDGLATQHTGEANRDFCRLASVVGITDGYYHDRFPDNMRDRVTHHLSLNAQTSGPPESDLLRSPQTTADLAARYLNAMRVSHGDLAVWLAGGGRIDNIPNRCDGCPFRAPCHAAFGAVDITAGSAPAPVEVGLYPFNAQALWTMYRQIDSASTSRTPRALLNSVLLYVMQSHAHKVAEGQFPPPPNDLGNDFRPPPPAKPIQQRTIDTQAGRDARRVEALALFWGDRTVDAIGERESRTVGGLPSAVFHAFDAPFIDGEAASAAPPGTVLPPRDIVLPPPDTVLPPSDPTPPPPPRGTRYDEDIAAWRAGGRLSQFEDLRRFLSYFIQSSIDWQGHGVPANIVDERLRPPRLRIEDQTGAARGDTLLFPRTDELGYVLQALAELNTQAATLDPATIGGHLATLGAWLHREEPRVVEHARRPSGEMPAPMGLAELLVLDCLLIEWSGDRLRVTADSPRDLLLAVLEGSGSEHGDRPLAEADWSAAIERAKSTHTKAWSDIMRSMGAARVKTCRDQLLRLLSRPQGDSQRVLFVDAATAIDILKQFQQRDWALRPITLVEEGSAPQAWRDGTRVYELYATRLDQIIAEERAALTAQLAALRELLGDSTPDEALRAITSTLESLREQGFPYTIVEPPGGGRMSNNAEQYLKETIVEAGRRAVSIRLSASTRPVEQTQSFTRYFEDFIRLARRTEEQLERKATRLQAESSALAAEQQAEQCYAALTGRLRDLAAIEVEEARP